MTFQKIRQAYLNGSSDFALATEKQVDILSEWLDKNDRDNSAHMEWEMYQEELRIEMASFESEVSHFIDNVL